MLGAGCWCWLCVWWRLGAGAGCCELAVRMVETGFRCWVLVLAARGGDRVRVLRARAGRWRQGAWKGGELRGS